MRDNLEIEVLVNGKKAETSLNKIKSKTKEIEKQTKSTGAVMSSSWLKVGAAVGSTYAAFKTLDGVYSGVIKNGLAFNKTMEQQTNSITTLLAATSDNVDSLGNILSAQEKYNLAAKEAIDIMEKLNEVNVKTPQSLEETSKIYKAMLPSMRNVGATQEEIITLTEKLAIASGSAGIEFNQLLAGVDGLATGTVLANSELGRFLSSIGLTNDKLKKSKNVVADLIEGLKGFDVLPSYEVSLSNFSNEWDKLTGTLTKDIFEGQKTALDEMTKLLKEVGNSKEDIEALKIIIADFANAGITGIEYLIKAFINLRIGILAVEKAFNVLATSIELGLKAPLNAAEALFINFKNSTIQTFNDIQIKLLKMFQNMAFEFATILDKVGVSFDLTSIQKQISNLQKDNLKLQEEANKTYKDNKQELVDIAQETARDNKLIDEKIDALIRVDNKLEKIADTIKNKISENIKEATKGFNNINIGNQSFGVSADTSSLSVFEGSVLKVKQSIVSMNEGLFNTTKLVNNLSKEKVATLKVKTEIEVPDFSAFEDAWAELNLSQQDQELRASALKYNSLLEQYKGHNATILELEKLQIAEMTAINTKYEEEKRNRQLELQNFIADQQAKGLTGENKEIYQLSKQYEEKYQLAKDNADLLKELEEQQQLDLSEIREKYQKEANDKIAEQNAKLYEDLSGHIANFVSGTKGSFKDMMKSIINTIIQNSIKNAFTQSAGGAGGGGIGGLLGGLFGGGSSGGSSGGGIGGLFSGVGSFFGGLFHTGTTEVKHTGGTIGPLYTHHNGLNNVRSDERIAKLQVGEAVVNRAGATNNREAIAAMNRGEKVGGDNGGGSTTANINFNVTAIDAASFNSYLVNNRGTIEGIINKSLQTNGSVRKSMKSVM